MKPINEMTKDELFAYAKDNNLKIDMRKNVELLRHELGKTQPEVKPEAPKKAKPTHLKHPTTGFFWPWTKLLEERGDLIPCDEAGHEV